MPKRKPSLEEPIVNTSWRRPVSSTVIFGAEIDSVYSVKYSARSRRFLVFRPGADILEILGFADTRDAGIALARRAEERRLAGTILAESKRGARSSTDRASDFESDGCNDLSDSHSLNLAT